MKSGIIYTKHIKGILPEFVRKSFGKCSRTGTIALLCLALIVITFVIYMRVGNHQFSNYDDNIYVTENPHVTSGITVQNIIWAFTSVEASNWHPITWLSHMADVQFYGMNPRGHHLANVAIHILSSVLLLLLLFRLTGAPWQSSFVAFLFALHPLHVESVAWVAERKDVLSAFFGFLTLFFYAEYVAKRKPSLYIISLFSFVLGLMSKPMLVTFPIVMLLMDFWPLGRYRKEERQELRQILGMVIILIKEKIPFFVCSLLSGAVTIYAQNNSGAVLTLKEIPFRLRSENAMIAYVKYIGNTLWPHDLAVLYPFPSSIQLWQVVSSLFILLLVSAVAIRARNRYPYVTVGWFWFLVTLVPVIGLLQVGRQSMADRYSYIPITGLFIIAAWGVPDLTKRLQHRQGILALLAGTVIIISSSLTWQQLGYWQDSIFLFRHTLQVTTDNSIIHDNLGATLAREGDLDAAIQEFRKALRVTPNNYITHYNLGNVLQTKGDLNAAILEYQLALRIYPNDADAHSNLGFALAGKGDLDSAIQEFQKTLQISPNDKSAHYNMGVAFARKGNLDAAIQEYRKTLRISPNDKNAHNNLGVALERKGELDKAIQEFQEALRINPNDTDVHNNLNQALARRRMQD